MKKAWTGKSRMKTRRMDWMRKPMQRQKPKSITHD